MLRVLFFGRVREELDTGPLEVAFADTVSSLNKLQQDLCERHGEKWTQVLGQDNIVRAVNQSVVTDDMALTDGDEIAFFPPVTGG